MTAQPVTMWAVVSPDSGILLASLAATENRAWARMSHNRGILEDRGYRVTRVTVSEVQDD